VLGMSRDTLQVAGKSSKFDGGRKGDTNGCSNEMEKFNYRSASSVVADVTSVCEYKEKGGKKLEKGRLRECWNGRRIGRSEKEKDPT